MRKKDSYVVRLCCPLYQATESECAQKKRDKEEEIREPMVLLLTPTLLYPPLFSFFLWVEQNIAVN